MENIELSKGDKGCVVGQVCNCATLTRRIPPCLTQYSVMVTDDLTRTDTCLGVVLTTVKNRHVFGCGHGVSSVLLGYLVSSSSE